MCLGVLLLVHGSPGRHCRAASRGLAARGWRCTLWETTGAMNAPASVRSGCPGLAQHPPRHPCRCPARATCRQSWSLREHSEQGLSALASRLVGCGQCGRPTSNPAITTSRTIAGPAAPRSGLRKLRHCKAHTRQGPAGRAARSKQHLHAHAACVATHKRARLRGDGTHLRRPARVPPAAGWQPHDPPASLPLPSAPAGPAAEPAPSSEACSGVG